MPWDRYLMRLIHHRTRRAFPGLRLWTSAPLGQESIVRLLRARYRQGSDVYFQPYACSCNAGYILPDLHEADRGVLEAMRTQGHQPAWWWKPVPVVCRPGRT